MVLPPPAVFGRRRSRAESAGSFLGELVRGMGRPGHGSSPRFLLNAVSKGLMFAVSSLESVFGVTCLSIDSKTLNWAAEGRLTSTCMRGLEGPRRLAPPEMKNASNPAGDVGAKRNLTCEPLYARGNARSRQERPAGVEPFQRQSGGSPRRAPQMTAASTGAVAQRSTAGWNGRFSPELLHAGQTEFAGVAAVLVW